MIDIAKYYAITVEEILAKTVVTKANSLDEALKKVEDAYRNRGEIPVEELVDVNINASIYHGKNGLISKKEAEENYYDFID